MAQTEATIDLFVGALLGLVGIIAAAALAYALIRPADGRALTIGGPHERELLNSWHRLRGRAAGWIVLVSSLLCLSATYCWHRAALASLPSVGYVLVFPAWAFVAPALFCGLAAAAISVDLGLRRSLRESYRLLAQYEADLGLLNAPMIMNVITFASAAVAVVFGYLATNYHAYFTDTSIGIRPFFSFHERRYTYDDIALIRTAPIFVAPNGAYVRRREYSFRFVDGFLWTTNDDPSGLSQDLKPQLATFIASRSSRPVEEASFLQRSDL
jgi:hypothetical protein